MNALVASHDVGVLSSKEDEEEEEDTLLSREHRRRRRRRAKMNSSHLPHDVGVSTNDGGHDKVEEDVPASADGATSSSSGVQGGSATASTTNQNNHLGALDVNEYQGEYGGDGEDEDKERVYYDEERVLVHQEGAYDPAAYDVMAAASFENRRLAGASDSCPSGDVVTCVDGFATMVGSITQAAGTTCQEACAAGGECCVGVNEVDISINSCTGFNGKVCKSGVIPSCRDNSTSGTFRGRACYNANIAEVFNGCNGRRACNSAGKGGDLGRVVNGCHGGDVSCYGAAYGGYINEIVDSCIGGEKSCIQAAYRGNISSITNGSCVGVQSCQGAAGFGGGFGPKNGGFIGYINQGCQGVRACQYAARESSIGGISYACNNINACAFMADGKSGFDSVNSAVVSCCNSESECTGSIVDGSTGSIVGLSGLPSGLPVTCEGIIASPTSSPTSSPTTSKVRILFINIICVTSNLSISNHRIYLFIFHQ